ncbi:MAG: glycosyltransferase family 39 protein [Bacteroidia bacterium]|nr:glycosyltransferase family 39 protein [Bacteroidia bacterium]
MHHVFKIALLALGFFILSVPLWLKVDHLPLRLWDESRNAVNAVEMYESGDWITRTYKNEPESYNLKPPMLSWFQSLAISVLGINEIAIRLPSIIASILSLMVVFTIVWISTKNTLFSFVSAGILATSAGFYGEHVGRFGDHDALVTLCSTLIVLLVLRYDNTKKPEYLYLMALTLVFGVLTKSITILMFAPGIFLYFLFSKNVFSLLKSKHFYLALVSFATPIIGYYILRESRQPGYLSLVWNDELFPRYLNTSKNLTYHQSDMLYYVRLLAKDVFSYWLILLPLAIVPFFSKKHRSRGLVLTALILASFIAILSKGTSNFWYIAPAIPVLSAFIGIGLHGFSKIIKIRPILSSIILFGALVYPYWTAHSYAQNTYEQSYNWETYGISYYLKNEDLSRGLSNNTAILLDSIYGFEPHLFYVKKLKHDRNITLDRKRMYHIGSGDTLLITHQSTFNWLQLNFRVKTLDSLNQYTKRVVVSSK